MPRKAKPLRMWAIKGYGTLCCFSRTNRRAIKDFMDLTGPTYTWAYWKNQHGYRAVRVTVREDTNGR